MAYKIYFLKALEYSSKLLCNGTDVKQLEMFQFIQILKLLTRFNNSSLQVIHVVGIRIKKFYYKKNTFAVKRQTGQYTNTEQHNIHHSK